MLSGMDCVGSNPARVCIVTDPIDSIRIYRAWMCDLKCIVLGPTQIRTWSMTGPIDAIIGPIEFGLRSGVDCDGAHPIRTWCVTDQNDSISDPESLGCDLEWVALDAIQSVSDP